MKRAHVVKLTRAMRTLHNVRTPDGYIVTAEFRRMHGRRVYMLSYLLPSLVHGSSVRLDTTEGTLWCAPTPSTYSDSPERERLWEVMRPVIEVAQAMQREHGTPLPWPVLDEGRRTYSLA